MITITATFCFVLLMLVVSLLSIVNILEEPIGNYINAKAEEVRARAKQQKGE